VRSERYRVELDQSRPRLRIVTPTDMPWALSWIPTGRTDVINEKSRLIVRPGFDGRLWLSLLCVRKNFLSNDSAHLL